MDERKRYRNIQKRRRKKQMIRGFAIAGLTMVCIFSAAAAIWARELGDNDQAQAVSAAVSGIDADAEGGGEESDTAAGIPSMMLPLFSARKRIISCASCPRNAAIKARQYL